MQTLNVTKLKAEYFCRAFKGKTKKQLKKTDK